MSEKPAIDEIREWIDTAKSDIARGEHHAADPQPICRSVAPLAKMPAVGIFTGLGRRTLPRALAALEEAVEVLNQKGVTPDDRYVVQMWSTLRGEQELTPPRNRSGQSTIGL